jgi:hypothetical protein
VRDRERNLAICEAEQARADAAAATAARLSLEATAEAEIERLNQALANFKVGLSLRIVLCQAARKAAQNTDDLRLGSHANGAEN